MLFNKKAFTLTIGNESSLLVLHNKGTVENKVLVPSLSQEDKIQILKIFKQNRSIPIHILLDNAEQSYTNKSYPSINRFDLKQIINRQIKNELGALKSGEEIVYNYMTHYNRKMRRWECLYVSSTNFEEMKKWTDFLLQEVSNPISGIYMLPIEAITLIKKIHKASKTKDKDADKKENNPRSYVDKITLLIIHNKVSGIRQVVFSNEKIIFTRITQYNYESKNFTVDFEQDIFRTNEYLKRILPNLKMEDVEIINILPRTVLEKISHIKNKEITFINYTPREVAEKIGHHNLIPKNSQFSDILIANIFSNSKKVLKSVTNRIKSLSIFNTLSRIILLFGYCVLFITFIYAIFIQIEQMQSDRKMAKLDEDKIKSEQNLGAISKQVTGNKSKKENGDPVQIDEIIDFGRLSEAMDTNKSNPVNFYKKLSFLNESNALANTVRYTNNYSIELGSENIRYSISGKIINDSGDVEKLFTIYDNIISETKGAFKEYQVFSSELPKDIDFSKKYYDMPFTLNISTPIND